MSENESTPTPASRLHWFGALLAGGGLSGWLIAWPIGWTAPLMPILLGVGIACLTLDYLAKRF